MFTVKVYRLDTPDGSVYVCTDAMLERLRQDGSEVSRSLLQRYEELLPACEEEQYQMRPYTFGERLQAEWDSTDWSTSEPRLNTSRMSVQLLAKSMERSVEEVEAMHPQLGALLWTELQMRCQPNPFAWTISSSRQQSSETESQQPPAPKSSSSRRGSAGRST